MYFWGVFSLYLPGRKDSKGRLLLSRLAFIPRILLSSETFSGLSTLSPAGGVCPGVPTRSEEEELLLHGDDRDESVFLRGVQRGAGCQYLLRGDGADHCQRG